MTIQRYQIADYLEIKPTNQGGVGIGNDSVFELMGAGFNTLDENPSAQTDSKVYINDKASTTMIKSYQTQFPFDSDLIVSENPIMELYTIGRNHYTGANAERDYVRVELFATHTVTGTPALGANQSAFKARKFKVAVEVSSFVGAGGETVVVSGNLNAVGDFIDGYFVIGQPDDPQGIKANTFHAL